MRLRDQVAMAMAKNKLVSLVERASKTMAFVVCKTQLEFQLSPVIYGHKRATRNCLQTQPANSIAIAIANANINANINANTKRIELEQVDLVDLDQIRERATVKNDCFFRVNLLGLY